MMEFQSPSAAHRRLWIVAACCALFAATAVRMTASQAEKPVPTPQQIEFFETNIRPVLLDTCGECHVDDDEGGLKLDSRDSLLKGGDDGPAVVPGQPEKSRLLHMIRRDEGFPRMPKGAPKLPDATIAAFAEWIKQGAPWPAVIVEKREAAAAKPTSPAPAIAPEQRAWWSFQPLAHPPAPDQMDDTMRVRMLLALQAAR